METCGIDEQVLGVAGCALNWETDDQVSGVAVGVLRVVN